MFRAVVLSALVFANSGCLCGAVVRAYVGTTEQLEIVLLPSAKFVVRDEAGAPMSGVHVFVAAQLSTSRGPMRTLITDAQGTAQLDPVLVVDPADDEVVTQPILWSFCADDPHHGRMSGAFGPDDTVEIRLADRAAHRYCVFDTTQGGFGDVR